MKSVPALNERGQVCHMNRITQLKKITCILVSFSKKDLFKMCLSSSAVPQKAADLFFELALNSISLVNTKGLIKQDVTCRPFYFIKKKIVLFTIHLQFAVPKTQMTLELFFPLLVYPDRMPVRE